MEDINIYLDSLFSEVDKSIKLDKEQKQAILCNKKHQLIIAGAGSGKTTVLAGKVKYLVDIINVEPSKILVISFTNKAVNELKERINIKMKINCDIKTFHKFGLDILKENEDNIGICIDNTEIIRELIKSKKTLCIRKLYCEYQQFHSIKKVFYLYNCFFKINNEKEEEFVSLLNTIITKIKNKEIRSIKNKKLEAVVNKIVVEYNNELKQKNKIDFTDMIVKSSSIIEQKDYTFSYDYIIIDEYQDISYSRNELIKKITQKFNTNLIVVGDDWQSIYEFSGSDINLFTNFSKEYPDAKILKITQTYRNSQQLINIAGKFIMQNNKQIKKELLSSKYINNPIEIVTYKANNISYMLSQTINKIIKDNPNKTILILGRYNFDINKFIDNNEIKYKNGVITYKNKHKIMYMTVHASKGLGFDNVILLNCKKGTYGFPTYKEDSNILKEINPKIHSEIINEERRLFYVALTRTKNKVYLMVPEKKESEFITEIKKYL